MHVLVMSADSTYCWMGRRVVRLTCFSLPKADDMKWVKDSTCLLWFPSPRDTSTTLVTHMNEVHKISVFAVFAVLHGQMTIKYQVYSIVSDLYWIQHFPVAALSITCPKLNACTYVLCPYHAGLLSGRGEGAGRNACFDHLSVYLHDFTKVILLPSEAQV